MNLSIEWTYRIPGDPRTVTLISNPIPVAHVLTVLKDMEKTGRVKNIEFIDEKGAYWTKKEIEKYLKSLETEPHEVIAYFDGGFNKEKNSAGLGGIIYFKKNHRSYRLRKNLYLEHISSNNEAECAALWFLLNEIENLGIHHRELTIHGDSHVIINQLQGDWPCYEEVLNRWLDRIQKKISDLGLTINFCAISRQENKEADQLAGQALRGESVSALKDLNEGDQA